MDTYYLAFTWESIWTLPVLVTFSRHVSHYCGPPLFYGHFFLLGCTFLHIDCFPNLSTISRWRKMWVMKWRIWRNWSCGYGGLWVKTELRAGAHEITPIDFSVASSLIVSMPVRPSTIWILWPDIERTLLHYWNISSEFLHDLLNKVVNEIFEDPLKSL